MARPPNVSPQTQLLLATLLAQPRDWRHGYDLSKETGLKSGTLYPLLIRLRTGALLEERWEPSESPGKPPRHLYRLTAQGLVLARAQRVAEPARRLQRARAGT